MMHLTRKSYVRIISLVLVLGLLCTAIGCRKTSQSNAAPATTLPTTSATSSTVDKSSKNEKPNLTTFDEMLAGFTKCDFPNVYIDGYTGKPAHSYFIERNMKPCEIQEMLAVYCVEDYFNGIPVKKIAIPRDTWPIHALYFDSNLVETRRLLKRKLGSEFRLSQLSKSGQAPELISNPDDKKKSILICTRDE
jgi:hypothetical protein